MTPRSRPGARAPRLSVQPLEDRSVPSAAALYDNSVVVSWLGQARAVPVPAGQTVQQAAAGWRFTPGVTAAEPNYEYRIAAVPNDPRFGEQYAQNNTGQSAGTADADVDNPEAWDTTIGGTGAVVAVIDSGVDYRHPDLYRNIWINQDEIPPAVRGTLTDTDGDGKITFWDLNAAANAGKVADLNANGYVDGGDLIGTSARQGWEDGLDNDGNGKADDLIGWDFANNDNDPFDDNNHGTHVAGTIGAVGNNGVGVAGVAWKAQIMPLKFLSAGGSGSTAAAVNAVNYSVGEGAGVSNNSWGGGGFSQTLYDAINAGRAAGQVFVAAAGNNGSNNDATANYPSNYNLPNVVAVAATDRRDALASFSNYGRATVDLAAPGVSILSTTPNNTYSVFSGTSMATPQVAGVFALVRNLYPAETGAQAIGRVLGAVDPIAAAANTTITGGRLNAARAVGTPPAADTAGPRVTAFAPNATGSNPVSSVRVTFSEAVLAASFTAADVAIAGPGGAVAVTGITAVGTAGTTFDIAFAPQSAAGSYSVTVGPGVNDLAGNPMNQDNDGTNGEAADAYAGSFAIAAAPTTTTFANPTRTTLPDQRTTTSTLSVGPALAVKKITVKLNITHTYTSDLIIKLISPAGTSVTLFDRRGGSGDNLSNTVFDDAAAAAVASAAAPFAGTYKPEMALGNFNAQNAAGTWTLTVQDAARLDSGTLNSWSISITS